MPHFWLVLSSRTPPTRCGRTLAHHQKSPIRSNQGQTYHRTHQPERRCVRALWSLRSDHHHQPASSVTCPQAGLGFNTTPPNSGHSHSHLQSPLATITWRHECHARTTIDNQVKPPRNQDNIATTSISVALAHSTLSYTATVLEPTRKLR